LRAPKPNDLKIAPKTSSAEALAAEREVAGRSAQHDLGRRGAAATHDRRAELADLRRLQAEVDADAPKN